MRRIVRTRSQKCLNAGKTNSQIQVTRKTDASLRKPPCATTKMFTVNLAEYRPFYFTWNNKYTWYSAFISRKGRTCYSSILYTYNAYNAYPKPYAYSAKIFTHFVPIMKLKTCQICGSETVQSVTCVSCAVIYNPKRSAIVDAFKSSVERLFNEYERIVLHAIDKFVYELIGILKAKLDEISKAYDINDNLKLVETSDISETSENTDTSTISDTFDTSVSSEIFDTSGTSDTSDAYETSETSEISDTSECYETSETSETSESSESSETSETSETSESY